MQEAVSIGDPGLADHEHRRTVQTLHPLKALELLRRLWAKESIILPLIFGRLEDPAWASHLPAAARPCATAESTRNTLMAGYSTFFITNLLLSTPRFRPQMVAGGVVAENV